MISAASDIRPPKSWRYSSNDSDRKTARPRINATANTRLSRRVSRPARENCRAFLAISIGLHQITDPAHRHDRDAGAGAPEATAQAVDVGIECVGGNLVA